MKEKICSYEKNWYHYGYLSYGILSYLSFLKSSTLCHLLIENNFQSLIHWLKSLKSFNFIALPWIAAEWKSLSFSAEKGNNLFEQVKQYHTVLSLINKLYAFTLMLLYLMWIHKSQLSHFTALWFLATGFRQIPHGTAVGIYSTMLKLTV